MKQVLSLLSIAFSLFLFYTAGFGLFRPEVQRVFPFLLALVMIVLVWPASADRNRKLLRAIDGAVVLASILSMVYLIL
ncbi:MAG: hypothetical protein HY882_06445 [Deltaproteobacteria bacterium]|nr:hypothetical protein [Deltaproteobacteria bacterium]